MTLKLHLMNYESLIIGRELNYWSSN